MKMIGMRDCAIGEHSSPGEAMNDDWEEIQQERNRVRRLKSRRDERKKSVRGKRVDRLDGRDLMIAIYPEKARSIKMCIGKKQFRSQQDAKSTAPEQRTYKCPNCKKWHLTTTKLNQKDS